MLEWLSLQSDFQFVHAGPVALQHFTRMMDLVQRQGLLAMQRTPITNAALQSTQLSFLVVGSVPLAQPFKNSFGFQLGRRCQFGFHLRPVLFKRVGAGTVAA